MADSPLSALFKLTPEEAVAYLQQRGELTQTFDWRDVWQEEHALQFTVSRLANLDILEAMRAGILSSVKGDSSRRDWAKNAKELLMQAGWWGKQSVTDPATGETVSTTFNAARLKLIFDTNTRMAYSAGRWQRIERNKDTHPYVRYITKRDERVRGLHRSWDNLTLLVDHPFWRTHTPPNGWRCRCRVVSISQAEYDAGLSPNGEALNKTAPVIEYRDWVNKHTGAVERVPVGIDPGFAYNPGIAGARAENLAKVEAGKLAQVSPEMVAAYRAQQFNQPWANGVYQYPEVKTVVPDTATAARAVSVAIENTIRRDDLETGVFISQAGEVLLRRQGQTDSVTFTAQELFGMRGALFTHNHPKGLSFSAEGQRSDLGMAIIWELGEVRAVSWQFRYCIQPEGGQWPRVEELEKTYQDAVLWAAHQVREMIIIGEIEPAARDIEISHQVLKYLSEKLKFIYVREAS